MRVETILKTVADMFAMDLEFMIAGRWLDLASLMITSADLVFSKASDKG
ncbi:hypothetical protein Hanom_Chr05g00471251 [Helianthus anomalus]